MDSRRRYYASRRRHRPRDSGLEAALRHIAEARQLSTELGGTDDDVKRYFFALPPEELATVLDLYEAKYGKLAREYAELTMPDWRSKRRAMSGIVAERLFGLLPGLMPVAKKFDLVKSLWERRGRRSDLTIYVGPDATDSDVQAYVRRHFEREVQAYRIPDSLVARFRWLAENDVDLQQQLYNYFLQLERDLVTAAAAGRLPQLLENIRSTDGRHARVTQEIEVAQHRLRIEFDPDAEGISIRPPERKEAGCLSVVVVAVTVLAGLLQYC